MLMDSETLPVSPVQHAHVPQGPELTPGLCTVNTNGAGDDTREEGSVLPPGEADPGVDPSLPCHAPGGVGASAQHVVTHSDPNPGLLGATPHISARTPQLTWGAFLPFLAWAPGMLRPGRTHG